MKTMRIIRGSTQELQTIYRMKNEPIISTGSSSTPNPQPKTTERYREAVELYRSTRLSCREISRTCSVSLSGLKGHICKYHRHLMLARYDISCDKEEAGTIRLGQLRGQQPATRAEYKEAVEARSSSMDYIEYNVSQIARRFGLDGTGLANQLRRHYPDILERREQERRRRGLADNQQRGVRPWCRERYAGAVELLRTTEMTVPEAAEACGVSAHGLSQHLLFYHHDLQDRRFGLREQAKGRKRKGRMTGNGQRHESKPEFRERYREAVRLYRQTPLTVREIADKLGMNRHTLAGYLQTWCRETAFERRGAEYTEKANISDTKHYLRSTAAKYAPAIERLRRSDLPTSKVAAEFGLHPDVFRQYLKEHEPELYARRGMMRSAGGRAVSRRSMEKYAEAVRLYETTDEDLQTIAQRLGLVYNSLGGFMRRHFPELLARHKGKATGPKG